MKTFYSVSVFLFLLACNAQSTENPSTSAQTNSSDEEAIVSVKGQNGKYNVDHNTSEYLHMLEHTTINFRDIANKRKPGIDIYNAFAPLLSRNIEEVISHCQMKGEGNDKLHELLAKIKTENKIMEGQDLQKANESLANCVKYIEEIKQNFSFGDQAF